MKKISHSYVVLLGLLVLLISTWATIQGLIKVASFLLSEEINLLPGTIALAVIVLFFLDRISLDIPMNQCVILLNSFSKKSRAVFEGFHFKLPWETVEYEVDLEVTMPSEIIETFPTTDGSVNVVAQIMSKPNSAKGEDEITRSRHMVAYVEFEPDTITRMQTARAKSIMREEFNGMTSEQAKSATSEQILNESDFEDLEEELHVDIVECVVEDVDYNDAVQEAQNDIFKAKTLVTIVETLMKDGAHSKEEAKALAPYIHKSIDWKKQVNVNEVGLSAEIISSINRIAEKYIAEKFK